MRKIRGVLLSFRASIIQCTYTLERLASFTLYSHIPLLFLVFWLLELSSLALSLLEIVSPTKELIMLIALCGQVHVVRHLPSLVLPPLLHQITVLSLNELSSWIQVLHATPRPTPPPDPAAESTPNTRLVVIGNTGVNKTLKSHAWVCVCFF